MNVFSWRFWLPIIVGGVVFALMLPLMLKGQEAKPKEKQELASLYTDAERMSVKDKQAEYWRLQAQAASILLQAEKLQAELSNEVVRMQKKCADNGGRFDPGAVSCTQIQAKGEGKIE